MDQSAFDQHVDQRIVKAFADRLTPVPEPITDELRWTALVTNFFEGHPEASVRKAFMSNPWEMKPWCKKIAPTAEMFNEMNRIVIVDASSMSCISDWISAMARLIGIRNPETVIATDTSTFWEAFYGRKDFFQGDIPAAIATTGIIGHRGEYGLEYLPVRQRLLEISKEHAIPLIAAQFSR